MKEESDYNMKLSLHENYYSKESGEYEFYINLYIEETKMVILISGEGYSDAQHVFAHYKPQAIVDILAKIHNNDEKTFKEYFKTYIFEATMMELIKTEWKNTMFNDVSIVFKDEAEALANG